MSIPLCENAVDQAVQRLCNELALIESRIAHGVWTWRDRERRAAIARELHDLEYAVRLCRAKDKK